jgi:hypothetical protein
MTPTPPVFLLPSTLRPAPAGKHRHGRRSPDPMPSGLRNIPSALRSMERHQTLMIDPPSPHSSPTRRAGATAPTRASGVPRGQGGPVRPGCGAAAGDGPALPPRRMPMSGRIGSGGSRSRPSRSASGLAPTSATYGSSCRARPVIPGFAHGPVTAPPAWRMPTAARHHRAISPGARRSPARAACTTNRSPMGQTTPVGCDFSATLRPVAPVRTGSA